MVNKPAKCFSTLRPGSGGLREKEERAIPIPDATRGNRGRFVGRGTKPSGKPSKTPKNVEFADILFLFILIGIPIPNRPVENRADSLPLLMTYQSPFDSAVSR